MHTDDRSAAAASHSDFDFVQARAGIHEYRCRTNELRVLWMREASAPVATFMVTYRVGSRNEGPGLTGATHYLEHLMFKGSRRFNRENGRTVFSTLQNLGARVNATTWLDRTNYYELLPRDHLELAAEIEADRMRGALLLSEDVDAERTVILNELDRGENEPMRKLYHSVWSTAFREHPYHHPTIGWREDVENMTRQDLRGFYDTFYWPNNTTVSVIGDVDADEVLRTVSRHFGSVGPSPHPIPADVPAEPAQDGERRVVVKRPGQLGIVMVAFKQPAAAHPDTYALDVLSVILTTGKSSRLHRRLTDRGLATGVFSSAASLRDPGLFYIIAPLAPEVDHEVVEGEIAEELRRVREGGVTAAELARAHSLIRASEAFGRDGSYAIAAQLNEAIAAGDWRLYTSALEHAMSVTAEDVRRVARDYCIERERTVGFYVPEVESRDEQGINSGDG